MIYRLDIAVRNTGSWTFAEYDDAVEGLREIIRDRATIVEESLSEDRYNHIFTIEMFDSDGWDACVEWDRLKDEINAKITPSQAGRYVEVLDQNVLEGEPAAPPALDPEPEPES